MSSLQLKPVEEEDNHHPNHPKFFQNSSKALSWEKLQKSLLLTRLKKKNKPQTHLVLHPPRPSHHSALQGPPRDLLLLSFDELRDLELRGYGRPSEGSDEFLSAKKTSQKRSHPGPPTAQRIRKKTKSKELRKA